MGYVLGPTSCYLKKTNNRKIFHIKEEKMGDISKNDRKASLIRLVKDGDFL